MENYSNFDKKLGEIIRITRKNKGLMQHELAEILKISPQQLQKYESGKNKINVEKLYKIADALNVSISDFMNQLTLTTISLPFGNFAYDNFNSDFDNRNNSSTAEVGDDIFTEDAKVLIKNYHATKSASLKNLLLFSSNVFSKAL